MSAAAVAGPPSHAASPAVELWLAEQWDIERTWGHLPGRGLDVLSALAVDAQHSGGPVIVVPVPRLAVIAAYVRPSGATAEPHLAVNPVLLAALEPASDELAMTAAMDRWSNPADHSDQASGARGGRQAVAGPTPMATGGNPYSFYGSFEECAAAQRARCEACLPGSSCTPITNASDGNTECTMLGANSGRGYFLLCINLALAITSVDRCTGDAAPTCVRDPHAADSLATLENNAAGRATTLDGRELQRLLREQGHQLPGVAELRLLRAELQQLAVVRQQLRELQRPERLRRELQCLQLQRRRRR
jgi:hypothetical protein